MTGMQWPPGTDDEVREYLAKVIVRCGGNLKKVAWEIGLYSRHKIILKMYKYRLWPLVNVVRRERIERNARMKKKWSELDEQ